MIGFDSEKLQETLLDLQRSQERENQLRIENAAILEGVSAMAGANNKRQVFNSLLAVLRKFIAFDNAIVLTRDDEASDLHVLMSTVTNLDFDHWQVSNTFNRCINGECIALYSPKDVDEFKNKSPELLMICNSSLITGVKISSGDAMIILMSTEKGHFTSSCRRVLNRFRPLLERAIIDIDYRERLQSLVTARTQELTHSQQRFKDFARTVGDWFWEIDTDHNFSYISASHIANHLIDKDNIMDIFDGHDDFKQQFREQLQKNQSFEDLEWQLVIDGKDQWLSFSGTPYYNKRGLLLGYRGTAKNISIRKKRLFDLQQARQQAESANKAKSQFIAMMSHEIRTPLNAVLGLMDLLSSSGLEDEQQQWLGQMEQSANLLLTIINDILDLSRIESGSFELFNSNINLSDSITLVKNQLQPEANKKDILLECDIDESIPEYIYADKNRIIQIMFNLIGNAIKFTNVGSVKISVTKVDNDIEVSVFDTGIGIAGDALNSLFNPFHQADGSITRKYGGTGLGLTISQLLIKKMKGSISIKSELGVGSCFTIRIPIQPAMFKKEQLIETKPTKSTQSLNILLAEDSLTNQLVAKLMLERRGHKVTITNHGEEAISKLLQCHNLFDLVLMDISMPVLDGLEATKHIRQLNIDTPIVALTANAMQSDQFLYQQVGMNGFLAKPIRPEELDQILIKYQNQLMTQ
ncbi:hybrid sensor histidine kinase/response regulator [Photobacterium aquimaris]|uniref:histidine kinase n=1 Tax=Photobacterium aquimaris TaxID=512643 RepID=A0A2T3ILD8_9GAMM|nr:PAS domain-containing hybrid sensor histidine kinase/response regulator [Photobacterium aquimaris]OBU12833.1 hybrid sensor histidine kinase/response regulator [Photobacterium aquimaris]OBU22405.1 hybrid sensor histidine kinase/response regulator [Photobacterium aquimaris]PSU29153.1 hybrid sensor histidine kinase/response regulator [Photobacterium aquimaris]PSW00784.1 hybrid sensor histidine kinase/response regulator [Photobacterium aquimaris]